MTSQTPIAFSAAPLMRGRPPGTDATWYDSARTDARARFAAYHRLSLLVNDDGPVWLERAALPDSLEAVFLGRRGEAPHFAVNVSALEDHSFSALGHFVDVRGAAGVLSNDDLATAGHGRSLIDWHDRHGFCARCGHATQMADGGAKRVCPSCEAEHFPRVDPVVIMLVARGDKTLLGRQRIFPPYLFTVLAGFMEPGETVEEAVAREVLEESGIPVANVRYAASQPWPFPSNIMIGCVCEGLSDEIIMDPHELDDARWFTKAEVREMLKLPWGSPELHAPPPFTIAHRLLKAWVNED